MDSKLEEQRFVIKFLLFEGEKPYHIFQWLQKSFSKACISHSNFYSWVSQFKEGKINMGGNPSPVTLQEVAIQFSISKASSHQILHEKLGMSMVSLNGCQNS